MPKCSALNCKNKGSHLFPKDATRRKQWESALRIQNFKANHTARLCAAHFKQEDYFGKSKYTTYEPLAKFLKKSAVPSIFCFTEVIPENPAALERQHRVEKRSQRKLQEPQPSTSNAVSEYEKDCDLTPELACEEIVTTTDTSTHCMPIETEMTEDRYQTREKRGKRSGFLRRVSLAQNIVPSPSEPQPGPSGQGAAKREHPDGTASPRTLQGDAKRVRTQVAQGEQSTYARATKDIPARLAVAICLLPTSRDMTTDEGEHIKLSLENLIVETCRTDPSKAPAFRGYPRVADGTVHIWCEDDNALTWLTQNVTKIRLPNNDATLTVMKQSKVPTRVRAMLFVPRYNGNIARLQQILICQNPWYAISRWSLYRATSVGGDNRGTYLTLGIPPEEVEKVMGRERRISYLLGSICVRFFPNTNPSDTQTNYTDETGTD